MSKFIFVLGGVASSLGKGTFSASIGRLLKEHGYNIVNQKMDPYLNAEIGKLSVGEHGEVYVLKDGSCCDLDLGHYERFTDVELTHESENTSGMIYRTVLEKERRGDYLGSTVQVIPHVTNEIKSRIYAAGKKADIVITEIGGTVGDIEGLPFIEAVRQVRNEIGPENVLYIHLVLLPYLSASGELKTKPAQHSVKELRGIGIQPDILVCRTEKDLTSSMKDKLALFCDVNKECIIENKTLNSVYEVPISLYEQNLDKIILSKLHLSKSPIDMSGWRQIVYNINNPLQSVDVAIVGKYDKCADAYLSVTEALKHAGANKRINVNVHRVHVENLDIESLKKCNGIVIADSSEEQCTESVLQVLRCARNNNMPYLGIGLGFISAIELFGGKTEMSQLKIGEYRTRLLPGTKVASMYNKAMIYERHCHERMAVAGSLKHSDLVEIGINPDDTTIDVVELKNQDFFVAVSYRPEFLSRPGKPHPLFSGFINVSKGELLCTR